MPVCEAVMVLLWYKAGSSYHGRERREGRLKGGDGLELCLDEWDQAGLSNLLNRQDSGSSRAAEPFQGTSLEEEPKAGHQARGCKEEPLKGGMVPERVPEGGNPCNGGQGELSTR